jgi:uncharacterized membrane protein YdjX (TVP38/TMEM64 family)
MRRAGKWLGIAVAVGGVVWALSHWAGVWITDFIAWVRGLGAFGPAVFIAAYALGTTILVPASILTMAAGVLFGVVRGTLYAFIGAVIAAVLTFLISRYVARRTIKRRLSADPRFTRIDRAIRRQGFRVVFLLRLSPVVPFSLINYALGLTRVRFVDYFLASVGLLPPTWLYVYNGMLMGEVARLGVARVLAGGAGNLAVIALGIVATVTVTVWLTRLSRSALR